MSELKEQLINKIKKDFANLKGAVVACSGGIDSSVVLCLAVEALGAGRVRAITMPSTYTDKDGLLAVHQLTTSLCVPLTKIDVQPAVDSIVGQFECAGKLEKGNLTARVRASTLMFVANKYGFA